MSYPVPVTSSALRLVIDAVAASFTATMLDDQFFVFTPSVACYIAQGAAPTASAANGSTYVAAGESVLIDGGVGAKLSVIRAGGDDGFGTLTRVKFVK